MTIQPYNKAQQGSLPGSDKRYIDQELLKIQTAIQSVEDAFGAWKTYTPVVTAGTGTLTSYTVNTARYAQIGKLVLVEVDVLITNAGSGSFCITISTPVANGSALYVISGRENVVTGKMLQGIIGSSAIQVFFYDNTFPGATNNRLVLSGSYEAA